MSTLIARALIKDWKNKVLVLINTRNEKKNTYIHMDFRIPKVLQIWKLFSRALS